MGNFSLAQNAALERERKAKWRKEYEEAEALTFMLCPKCGQKEVRYRTICLNCKSSLPVTYDDSKDVIQIPGMAMERIKGDPAAWLPSKILYGRSYHPSFASPKDLGCWVAIDATKGVPFTESFHTEEDVWKWINYEPVQNWSGKWLNIE